MFEDFLEASLADLDRRNLRRRLRISEAPTGPVIKFGGRTLHNFASNDYLGLAAHHDVVEAAVRATRDFGAGSGASRLVSGTQLPHRLLEEKLAAFKQTEAAMAFGSGYATGTGVLPALAGKSDVILLDRLSHASLVDGARLSGAAIRPFRHNDPDQLEHHLRWAREKHPTARIFIVTESVFSMDGDAAPLREIVDLKDRHGAILILDEAHAVGVLGRGGRGLADELGVGGRIEVQMGTLGKALGSSGGYIAGSRRLVDFLINRARSFLFSTAPPAATAAAATTALDICTGREGDLRRAKLKTLGNILDPSRPAAIFPWILGSEETALRAGEALMQLGFFVPAIRPPTVPPGSSRLRASLSSAHAEDAVRQLRAALEGLDDAPLPDGDTDSVCPVCGGPLTQEKCKVVCRSTVCGYRIVFNCSEF
ncbi:MAG: 8-amino-7-oxononanoate synthase [Chthoniobacterales bacterium]|nr:8-amino-7-oxononanoate synthase [Chthoniobacterales bacterium]